MVETPRAALTADRLAEHADFFSIGSNDLTQTTYALSRDDAETSFLVDYLRTGIYDHDPFTSIDPDGVGTLIDSGRDRGRASAATASRSASAASTAATRPRSPGATSTASPTSAAHRSGCRSPAWPPPRRPWPRPRNNSARQSTESLLHRSSRGRQVWPHPAASRGG